MIQMIFNKKSLLTIITIFFLIPTSAILILSNRQEMEYREQINHAIEKPVADEYTVSLWHFDENSGSIAYDSSTEYDHDGTIYGANWTEGISDYALSFNRTGEDYVSVWPDIPLSLSDSVLTIELWVYFYSVENEQVLIVKSPSEELPSGWVVKTTPEHFLFEFRDMDGTTKYAITGTSSVEKEIWYNLFVVSYGYSIEMWINDTLDNEVEFDDPGIPKDNEEFLFIGAANNWTEKYFLDGILDEIHISHVARDRIDTTGPGIIEVSHSPSAPDETDKVTIGANIEDHTGVKSASVVHRTNNGSWSETSMSVSSDTRYEAIIGPFAANSTVEYYIKAIDSSPNENVEINNNFDEYFSFRVTEKTEGTNRINFSGFYIVGIISISIIFYSSKRK